MLTKKVILTLSGRHALFLKQKNGIFRLVCFNSHSMISSIVIACCFVFDVLHACDCLDVKIPIIFHDTFAYARGVKKATIVDPSGGCHFYSFKIH